MLRYGLPSSTIYLSEGLVYHFGEAYPPVLEGDEIPRTDGISHHSVRESGSGKRADTYCSVFCFGRV